MKYKLKGEQYQYKAIDQVIRIRQFVINKGLRLTKITGLIILFTGCFSTLRSVAQMFSPDYGYYGAPMSNFLSTSYLTQQVVNDNAFGKNVSNASTHKTPTFNSLQSGSTVIAISSPPIMPAKLSAFYPAEKRAEVTKVFGEVLNMYHKIEANFGVPKYDLAAAIAAFLAGSWTAYHNQGFPDENFLPLVEQIRGIIASNPQLQKANVAEKQEMYEQMAIIGTFMAVTQQGLQQQPNSQITANMQQTAKGYLEQFLQVNVNNVVFTKEGMTIKSK